MPKPNNTRLIEEIKRRLPAKDFFKEEFPEHYKETGNSHCPAPGHKDDRPSLQINKTGVYCHGCRETYDVIALHMIKHGVDRKTAVKELGNKLRLSGASSKGLGDPQKTYDYTDENGKLLFQVCRFPGKKFLQRRPDGNGGWIYKIGNTRKVLYNQDAVTKADTVFLHGGEKDVESMGGLGLCATTNSGGEGNFVSQDKKHNISKPLKGKNVVIIPDNDEPGRKHALQVAERVKPIAKSVKIVNIPGLPEKGDVSDYIEMHGKEKAKADILKFAEETPEWEPTEPQPESESNNTPDEPTKKTKFERVLEFVNSLGFKPFIDQYGNPWVTVPKNGHFENHPLNTRSSALTSLIIKLFVDSEREGVSRDIIGQVIDYLAASAEDQRTLHNRFAGADDKCLIDMGDEGRTTLRITADNACQLITENDAPPFVRYQHMRPLPAPKGGGSLEKIFHYCPIKNPGQGLLLKVYVVTIPLDHIARPLAILHGPQGSAKTSTTVRIRSIWDPSVLTTLSLPKDHNELIQLVNHHAVCPLDNLHYLPQWASDAICRAVTGSGNSKRTLYSDLDDTILFFKRTLILNGICLPGTNADLLDRSILIEVPRIPESERRTDIELDQEFAEDHPKILGAACEILSEAMRIKPQIKSEKLPRLADWFLWGLAISKVMGHKEDEFREAYYNNIGLQHIEILDDEPLYRALDVFLFDQGSNEQFSGQAQALLKALNRVAEKEGLDRAGKWPKGANALSRKLKKLSHSLDQVGINVTWGHEGRGRNKRKIITLKRIPETSTPSTTDPATNNNNNLQDKYGVDAGVGM